LFLSCFFLMTVQIRAQSNNTITGFVQDGGRTPIASAAVELMDDFHRLVARVTTDGAGRYSFFRLPLGRYSIRVSLLGSDFLEETVELEITSAARSGSSAETIQQNFILHQKNLVRTGPRPVNQVIVAQDIPKDAQKLYEKALSSLKDKRSDDAISELKNAVAIFPRYHLALQKLGEEYIARQRFQEAIDVLLLVIEIEPRSYDGQYGLAYSLYQMQKHQDALVAVDKSLEINSSSVNSLFLRGMILKHLGLFEKAVESLNMAKKKSTVPAPDIYWQLSLIYTNNLKKYSAAADELELFLKAKPDYAESEKVRDLIKKLRAKS